MSLDPVGCRSWILTGTTGSENGIETVTRKVSKPLRLQTARPTLARGGGPKLAAEGVCRPYGDGELEQEAGLGVRKGAGHPRDRESKRVDTTHAAL